jgi:exodeoxyribonuclease X
VKRVCTLALSRHFYPELDSHSLTAMTYALQPNRSAARDMLRRAHSAATDALLVRMLLEALLDKKLPHVASWASLWQASEVARMPTRFTFGKYGPSDGKPGVPIAEVRRTDPGYIEWCLYKCDQCKDEYWQRALRGEAA